MHLSARTLANIDKTTDDCWTWLGKPARRFYGPHKRVYEAYRGNVPKGLVLDHRCENKICVNPWHLFPVTNMENVRRGKGKFNTDPESCINGHPQTPETVYQKPPDKNHPQGRKDCRVCTRERVAKRRTFLLEQSAQDS